MKTINNLIDNENVFSGLLREQTPERKRKSTSAVACLARILANRVIILCKSDFKMQTHAHYLRDRTVLLKMRMEIHNAVAVSCQCLDFFV